MSPHHSTAFHKIFRNFSERVSGTEDELVWNANQDVGTSSLCLPITPGPPVLKSSSELPKSVLLGVSLLPLEYHGCPLVDYTSIDTLELPVYFTY